MRSESIDEVAGNCVPQTNQPDARQQVNNQGLLSKCWSNHTASTDSTPKTPGIMASIDQKCGCVGDELRNKRGVLTLRYPRRERSRLLDCPLQRCGSGRRISYYSNCEPRQTAFDAAETAEFQSVARSVVETTVSLPSCQQAQSIGSQCRPSQTNPSAKRCRISHRSHGRFH